MGFRRLGNYTLSPDEMGHRVLRAVPLTNTHLLLRFGEAEWRIIDMAPFIEQAAVFRSISGIFERVGVEAGAVVWPDGAALHPDVAYWESVPAGEWFSKPQTSLTSASSR